MSAKKPSEEVKNDLEELMSKLKMDSTELDNEQFDSNDDDEEAEARLMAICDECHDGLWLADGHDGMMIELSSADFEVNQMDDYLDESFRRSNSGW